jgi:hypothetical protein
MTEFRDGMEGNNAAGTICSRCMIHTFLRTECCGKGNQHAQYHESDRQSCAEDGNQRGDAEQNEPQQESYFQRIHDNLL